MTESCDVLVIGAGPAGLAAAGAAAARGARVVVVDAQARAGGQVWRHDLRQSPSPVAASALAALQAHPNLGWRPGAQVIAAEPGRAWIECEGRAEALQCAAMVLATGARELLLPFPGWSLPGATGAGGLQALAKQGWPVAGRRVLVAGSGPLLLAAAATLRRHGARVLAVCEQAPATQAAAFAARLWRWPGKLVQAAALRARLAGVPYRPGRWVRAAHGEGRVSEVEIDGGERIERIACDLLAVGYGLVPNLEIARLLGCELDARSRHPCLRVDQRQATSVAGVYAAGEACGIGGVDAARAEGAIAGLAAVGADASALYRRRDRARAFAALLPRHFALRPEVHACATPQTLVCRCEDVSLAQVLGHADARAARLATRCGMGSCQGRVCGAALAELAVFPPSPDGAAATLGRPPVFPARLGSLAALAAAAPVLPPLSRSADAAAAAAGSSIEPQGSCP